MPYELASLIVSIGADKSALAQVLAQTRAELSGLADSGVDVKLNPVAGSDAAAQAAQQMKEAMAGLRVPDSILAQVAQINSSMGGAASSASKASKNLAGAGSGASQASSGIDALKQQLAAVSAKAEQAAKTVATLQARLALAGQTDPKPKGDVKSEMDAAAAASKSLLDNLTGMTGLKLDNILALGSLAGIGGAMYKLFETFKGMNDEAATLPIRLRQAGGAMGESLASVNTFRDQLASTGRASFAQISEAIDQAATKGPERFRSEWKSTVESAFALSAATGQTVDQSVRLLNLGQQNYTNLGRVFRQIGLQLRPNATKTEYDEALALAVARGRAIQEARDKTIGVQIVKVQNALVTFGRDMANAFGSALEGPFRIIATSITQAAAYIREFVADNQAMFNIFAKVFTGLMLLIGGLVFLKGALLGARVVLGQVGGLLFGPLRAGFGLALQGAMTLGRGLWLGVTAPGVAANLSMKALGKAIQAVFVGTVIGAPLAFAAAIFQAIGGVDLLIGTCKKLWAFFSGGGGGKVFTWLSEAWIVIQREAEVVWVVLQKGWNSVVEAVGVAIGFLMNLVAGIFGNPKQVLESAASWIQAKFTMVTNFLWDAWNEFLMEFSVAGLRLQQYWLMYAVIVENFGVILDWLGELFASVMKFISEVIRVYWGVGIDFVTATSKALGEYLIALHVGLIKYIGETVSSLVNRMAAWVGQLLAWLVNAITAWFTWLQNNWQTVAARMYLWAKKTFLEFVEFAATKAGELYSYISNPKKLAAKAFDFLTTRKEIDESKKAADEVGDKIGEIKWPAFPPLTGEAWEKVKQLQAQIEEQKRRMKIEMDRLRAQRPGSRNRAAGTVAGKAKDPSTGRQTAGGFGDLLSQWKKVQEAAVGGQFNALEEEAKKQTAGQKEGNQTLAEMNEQLKKLAEGGGIGPPGPPIPE